MHIVANLVHVQHPQAILGAELSRFTELGLVRLACPIFLTCCCLLPLILT